MKKSVFLISNLFTLILSVANVSSENIPVNLDASKITVDIQSTLVSTTATLKRFSGYLEKNGSDISNAKVVLASKGSDVAFAKLPIEQMILVSSLLQSVTNDSISFESQSIEQAKDGYLLKGIALSGKHRELITVPVSISKDKKSNRYTFITQYSRAGNVGGKNSQFGSMLGKVSTKGNLQIVFGG
jgi:hypothetical protein